MDSTLEEAILLLAGLGFTVLVAAVIGLISWALEPTETKEKQ